MLENDFGTLMELFKVTFSKDSTVLLPWITAVGCIDNAFDLFCVQVLLVVTF